jgi:hypothetical protein
MARWEKTSESRVSAGLKKKNLMETLMLDKAGKKEKNIENSTSCTGR